MAEASTKRSLQSNGQLLPNQKMRTTCNACQQAKIRCSHTYPCDRCESHGYECVYSISQPLGRPAKRKMIRPAAAGAGIKMRRKEVEGVDRPTRRSAGRAPRPAPEERAQRARRVPSRIPSPTTSSGSGPSSREESYKSDSSTGTEVTPPEGDFQWSSFTKLLSDVPGNHKIGQGIQDQKFVNANEANNHVDPGFSDTSLESSFERNDGFESSGGPRFPEPRVDYSTQCYTSHIGLMVDEPPIGGFLHTAAPGTQYGSLFRGGAIYPFSLAPNAIQVSGTVRDPARIMELPSNEICHEPADTDSSQSLPLKEIDLEALPEDASSLHCNCYAQAFSEVMQSEEVNGSNKILLHLERVQQQGVVILQCQVCFASNARANILTLLVMAIEKAARALKVRAKLATTSVQGGVCSVWGEEDISQMRRCLSHLSIIVRFIHQDLHCASPSKWHLVMADETDRRLQSIIRIFE
ncbi:uncharacterized protein N7518_003843 [Penicillium psychrosexuale]|uniref:uncharacterized protein n=1 Tax=Penicillium psychrosexuale TaxID=1002107 RepID=UPI0025456CF1|nr:uncharacterized protein N7518_003843 [Penicillium psychrosexuale]KAJ5801775.1 hypothetical protein N7518_003843 [Penicillium psychrosexuale]